MSGAVRWLIALVIAMASWQWATATAAAEAPVAALVATINGVGPRSLDEPTNVPIDRGPQVIDLHEADDGADGFRSRGAIARPDGAAPPAAFAYDDAVQRMQVARTSGTTKGQARVVGGNLSSLSGARSAAKTGTAGADDVLNGVRLRAQLTGQEVSGGRAFEKQTLDLGEFPGIRTRAQFAAHKVGLDVNNPAIINRGMSVQDFIAQFRNAKVLRESPGEYLDQTVEQALRSGDSTVRKLLTDGRWAQ